MIKQLGQGCFLAKTDIKSAFRIIPILPRDYDLLGIFWQGKYYYDRVTPMGCASSCRTFEMFSTAIGHSTKHGLDWTGQLDWTIGLDSWTGQLDWTVGLDYWTGILFY